MEFSALNLTIKTVGEKEATRTLENIDRRAEQSERLSKKQVDDAVSRYDRMYGSVAAAAEKSAIAAEKSAERRARSEVQAYADIEKASERAANTAAASAERMEVRFARATQYTSRGLEMLGRTGNLTGRSLDAVLGNVAGLALGFGTGGLLVGAIAIGTSAIVEMFMRTRREMEKTQTEFSQRIVEMAKAGNVAGMSGRYGTKSEIFSGDEYAKTLGRGAFPKDSEAQFIARSEGQTGLQKYINKLQASPTVSFNATSEQFETLPNPKLKEAVDLMVQMGKQWEYVDKLAAKVTATVEDQNNTARKLAAEKHEGRDAKKDATLAAELRAMELHQLKAHEDSVNRVTAIKAKADEDINQESYKRGETSLADYYAKREGLLKDATAREIAVLAKERDTVAGTKAVGPVESLKRAGDLAALTDQITEIAARGAEAILAVEREKGVALHNIDIGVTRDYIAETIKRTNAAVAEGQRAMKKHDAKVQAEAMKLASTFGNALTAGFTAAFKDGGGFSAGIKAFGGSIIAALGDMFEQVGEKALAGMTFMQSLADAIASFNPAVGIPAAIALIALGAAMKGAGSRVGSSSSGGSSSAAGNYGAISNQSYVNGAAPSPSPSAAGITPRPSVTNVNYIIGPADPQAQRMWNELQRSSLSRGSLG